MAWLLEPFVTKHAKKQEPGLELEWYYLQLQKWLLEHVTNDNCIVVEMISFLTGMRISQGLPCEPLPWQSPRWTSPIFEKLHTQLMGLVPKQCHRCNQTWPNGKIEPFKELEGHHGSLWYCQFRRVCCLCDKEVPLGLIEEHYKDNCWQKCTLCNVNVPGRDGSTHGLVCVKRFTCECQLRVSLWYRDDHLQYCTARQLCIYCNTYVLKTDMYLHSEDPKDHVVYCSQISASKQEEHELFHVPALVQLISGYVTPPKKCDAFVTCNFCFTTSEPFLNQRYEQHREWYWNVVLHRDNARPAIDVNYNVPWIEKHLEKQIWLMRHTPYCLATQERKREQEQEQEQEQAQAQAQAIVTANSIVKYIISFPLRIACELFNKSS